jgi:hypothetical protein
MIAVFFFWPAGQALVQSCQQDAFGTRSSSSGWRTSATCSTTTTYLASFKTTAVFSVLVALLGLALSLVLAVMADRVVKGSRWYKNAADLALRGGAGGGRGAVAVHVRAQRGRRVATCSSARASNGTTCSTARRP